jgi:DNA replication initiation complex subunit (GINS family)
MKNLTQFNNNDLQKLYEDFGNELLKDIDINESLSDRIENVKQIASKLSGKVTDKISKTAQIAISNIKKKAGNAWNQIKDIYTTIVSFIDQTLVKWKPMISDIAKFLKMNDDEIQLKLATAYVHVFAKSTKTADKILKLMMDFPETTKQLIIINVMILSTGFISDYGLDLSFINDLYDALKASRGSE